MSAVPQAATQIDSIKAAREGTMMLPEGKTIKSMVASIRPQPEADFALDTIRDQWVEFQEEFATIAPKLKEGLATLSGFWKGDDFDGFEEQTETVLKNCKTVSGDIAGEDGKGGVVKLLDDKQTEIYDQQGGTSCAYPAPKFYMQGTSCGSHQIHIRPPFFKNCEIHKNDEISKAVELAGFDPTVIDEVQEGRETTYNSVDRVRQRQPRVRSRRRQGRGAGPQEGRRVRRRAPDLLGRGGFRPARGGGRPRQRRGDRAARERRGPRPGDRARRAQGRGDHVQRRRDRQVRPAGPRGRATAAACPTSTARAWTTWRPPADLKSLAGNGPGGLNGDTSGLNGDTGGLNGNNADLAERRQRHGDLNWLNDENPFAPNTTPTT